MANPKPVRKSRIVVLIRTITLGCAVIGFLLSIIWPIVDMTSWRQRIDNLPDWLGLLILFIVGCYGFWEVRLFFAARSPKGHASESGQTDSHK